MPPAERDVQHHADVKMFTTNKRFQPKTLGVQELRFLLATVLAASAIPFAAPAHAGPDPHTPDPFNGYCPGGGGGNAFEGYCDGLHYPVAQIRADGASDHYAYTLHARLSQILSDAVHDGLLGHNPCSRRTSPPRGKQKPYVASTEQVWALHDVMPEHLQAAVLLGAFAGLRISEACGLRVDDVDLTRGVVHPHQQYGGAALKTAGSEAPIPIPRELTLLLAASVQRYPSKWMVTDGAGGSCPPRAIERAVVRARAKVDGLPAGFTFHDLRHYLASLLIASGADIKTVQARLRHASASTTLDTYGHLWPDADESTRAAVGAAIRSRIGTAADALRTN